MEIIVGRDKEANKAKLMDLDTGKEILFVWAADDEAGLYAQYENDGERITHEPGATELETVTKEGNIQIIIKGG